MKEKIKEILRENITKNILGVTVSKPNQELIVMRGIPGAGKSTKAKSLVGQGKIHSTDDVIEAGGDYNEFFAKMIATKDFTPLSKVHATNLSNAIESMKAGVSPVIIDNTNIKQNESKAYVVAALEMGYADNNIKFVDIGTAGLEAAELAKRNAHGVPLDKIEMMIASHTAQGPLTLQSVLGSKDMYKESNVTKNIKNVSYSCVLLDEQSRKKLLDMLEKQGFDIPKEWKVIAHHMTINMGKLKDDSKLGNEVTLTVEYIGRTNKVIAVKVSGYERNDDKVPHITIAVNPDGGKPVMSNYITNWYRIDEPFDVNGVIAEI